MTAEMALGGWVRDVTRGVTRGLGRGTTYDLFSVRMRVDLRVAQVHRVTQGAATRWSWDVWTRNGWAAMGTMPTEQEAKTCADAVIAVLYEDAR